MVPLPSMRLRPWDACATMPIKSVLLGSESVFPLYFRQYGYVGGHRQQVVKYDFSSLHAKSHWQ